MTETSPTPQRLAQERHLTEATDVVRSVCLVDGPDGACTAAVVLETKVLDHLRVPLLRARLMEDLQLFSKCLPSYEAIADFVVLEEMPLLPDSEVDRQAVADQTQTMLSKRWTERSPRSDDWKVLVSSNEVAARFLHRLAEIVGHQDVHPQQEMEKDLGYESLMQTQLMLVARQEFGARIAPEMAWRLATVEDWVRQVVANANPTRVALDAAGLVEPAETSWSVLIRQPTDVPLFEKFKYPRPPLDYLRFRMCRATLKAYAWAYHGIEIVNRERLPTQGPALLCPTHVSLMDSVLCYPTLPLKLVENLWFVAFGEYFESWKTSWLTETGHLIHTGPSDETLTTLRYCFQVLEAGRMMCIFPEGVRTYQEDGGPMAPRPGVGLLACETQTPIIPIVFQGSEGTMAPWNPGLNRCKIHVVVGEPIHPPVKDGPFTWEDYHSVTHQWLLAIRRMRTERGLDGK